MKELLNLLGVISIGLGYLLIVTFIITLIKERNYRG
jgi:hypothetical protein